MLAEIQDEMPAGSRHIYYNEYSELFRIHLLILLAGILFQGVQSVQVTELGRESIRVHGLHRCARLPVCFWTHCGRKCEAMPA